MQVQASGAFFCLCDASLASQMEDTRVAPLSFARRKPAARHKNAPRRGSRAGNPYTKKGDGRSKATADISPTPERRTRAAACSMHRQYTHLFRHHEHGAVPCFC